MFLPPGEWIYCLPDKTKNHAKAKRSGFMAGDPGTTFLIPWMGKIKNQFEENWFIRAEDGFEPATFSWASIIQRLTREYEILSNLDLHPSTNLMKKNVKKNVVFYKIEVP